METAAVLPRRSCGDAIRLCGPCILRQCRRIPGDASLSPDLTGGERYLRPARCTFISIKIVINQRSGARAVARTRGIPGAPSLSGDIMIPMCPTPSYNVAADRSRPRAQRARAISVRSARLLTAAYRRN